MRSLKFRVSRDCSDELGQVFTPPSIARLLAKGIPAFDGLALDLGAGAGALSKAVVAQHGAADMKLVEIDRTYAGLLKAMPDFEWSVLCANVLDDEWALELKKTDRKIDAIICNPPYGMLKHSKFTDGMRRSSGLKIPMHGGWIKGDLAFVARAWELSAVGAHFGFIVSNALVLAQNCLDMRRDMLSQLSNLCVTKIPLSVFNGAEVQAYVITGTRSIRRQRNVVLRKAGVDGNILQEMTISHHDAVRRMDIDFYLSLEKFGLDKGRTSTLGELGAQIYRGSHSKREFDKIGVDAFHTTNFTELKLGRVTLANADPRYRNANEGDFLVPRVGSRCLIRQGKVVRGNGCITDSVFGIKIKDQHQKKVWETLNSSFCADWRLANASGSCAKFLTTETLLSMPILV